MSDERTCLRCGDTPSDGELGYLTVFGLWDGDRETFDTTTGTSSRLLCQSCWKDHEGKPPAAHYEVENYDRLLAVLAAADGRLAANCAPLVVGSAPFARVVDGELEGVIKTAQPAPDDADVDVEFVTEEWGEVDERFKQLVSDHKRSIPGNPTVRLHPVDETPFPEWNARPDEETTLDRGGWGETA